MLPYLIVMVLVFLAVYAIGLGCRDIGLWMLTFSDLPKIAKARYMVYKERNRNV